MTKDLNHSSFKKLLHKLISVCSSSNESLFSSGRIIFNKPLMYKDS